MPPPTRLSIISIGMLVTFSLTGCKGAVEEVEEVAEEEEEDLDVIESKDRRNEGRT